MGLQKNIRKFKKNEPDYSSKHKKTQRRESHPGKHYTDFSEKENDRNLRMA